MTTLESRLRGFGYRPVTAAEEGWINDHPREAPWVWAEGDDPDRGGSVAVLVVPISWQMPRRPQRN